MVRWKRQRRWARRSGGVDETNVGESSNESSRESDDEALETLHDGEDEDNYRDPMIRLAYISIIMLATVFTPAVLFFALFIEVSVYSNRESRAFNQKDKCSAGLRTPPMARILEDRSRFKQEIRFLKNCNLQLTHSTWINTILEILALSYSLLLLATEKNYLYPACQLILHCFIRINHVYADIYARFFAPEDVTGALFAEVIYDLVCRLNLKHCFSGYVKISQCPLELLIFPILLSIAQVFANQKHARIYENERFMRKQIRERYIQEGSLHFYSTI